MNKQLSNRKNMVRFFLLSIVLIVFSSFLELSSQVTNTIIILTIISLINMEIKIKVLRKNSTF